VSSYAPSSARSEWQEPWKCVATLPFSAQLQALLHVERAHSAALNPLSVSVSEQKIFKCGTSHRIMAIHVSLRHAVHAGPCGDLSMLRWPM
jgi:hypothetical protein